VVAEMDEVTGYVLAGGRATRMGRDKRLFELQGRTLLDRAADLLQRVLGVPPYAVGDNLAGIWPDPGRIITDARPGCGPLGGLAALLTECPTRWALVLAADMPLVRAGDLLQLVKRASAVDRVVALSAGVRPEPLAALYHRDTSEFWRRRLEGGNFKLDPGFRELGWLKVVPAEPGQALFNVNRAEDLEWLRDLEEARVKTVHLSVVGRKNSGKTTLMTGLIEELVRRGFSVGTVKHTSHAHEFDTPGKDSWRHRQAGSRAAVILSPGRWSCHADQPEDAAVHDLHRTLFQGRDLVLWEGRGNDEASKVECVPPALPPLNDGDPSLEAVVSATAPVGGQVWFQPGDTGALADWIVERFALTAGKPDHA
jgi:molybdopterin-guanine dinucleotide biosynthesis protein